MATVWSLTKLREKEKETCGGASQNLITRIWRGCLPSQQQNKPKPQRHWIHFCSLRVVCPQEQLHPSIVCGSLEERWVQTHLQALHHCISLTMAFSSGFCPKPTVALFDAMSVSSRRNRDGLKMHQVRALCSVLLLLQCRVLNSIFEANWTMASLMPEESTLSRPKSSLGGMAPTC